MKDYIRNLTIYYIRTVDHTLITATVITGGGGLAALYTGIGISVSIALGSISISLSIATVITRKTNKIYDAKIKKHDKIGVLAKTKLDSIHDTVSKAIEDGHVSPEEFQRIVQEKQRYLLLKKEIRHKTKRVTNTLKDEQRRAILDQSKSRKKRRQRDFLRQIGNSLDIRGANDI